MSEKNTVVFKAKMVDHDSYYGLRLGLALIAVVCLLFCISPIWSAMGNWLWAAIALGVLLGILSGILRKRIKGIFGQRKLEASKDRIDIIKKGKLIESIDLASTQKLSVKKDGCVYPDEAGVEWFWQYLKGPRPRNVISVTSKGHDRNLNFEFDSHYSVKQLEKLMGIWENRGINISAA